MYNLEGIPDFAPFRIAAFEKGVVSALQPWLAPEDTWRDLQDMRVRRGRLEVRKGYEIHGTCYNRDTFTQGSTSGLTNVTGTLPNAPLRGFNDSTPTGTFVIDDDPAGAGQVGTATATIFGIHPAYVVSGPGISAGSWLNVETGFYDITFAAPAANDVQIIYDYDPELPVQGLWDFLPRAGGEFVVACNTRRLFVYNSANQYYEDQVEADTFTGGGDDYFDFVPFEDILVVNNGVDHTKKFDPVAGTVTDMRTWFGFTSIVGESVPDVTNPIAHTLTFPVKELSVRFEDSGTQVVTDDGEGGLIGDVASPGTIDYDTGVCAFSWAAGPTGACTVDYDGGPASEIESAKRAYRHRERLLFANTIESTGQVRTNRIRRTRPGLPERYRDEFDFNDVPTNPAIRSGGIIGDSIIIFHEQEEAWLHRYTGDPVLGVYENIPLSRMYGSIAPFSTIEMESTIVTLDVDAVVETDARTVNEIDEEAPLYMEDGLDPDNAFRCHGILQKATEEQWWTFVRLGQTNADRVLVRNYKTGSYSLFKLAFNVFGFTRDSASLVWDDLAGPAGTLTADDYAGVTADSYASVANETFLVGGDLTGSIWRIGRAASDNGVPIVATARSQKLNTFDKKRQTEQEVGHIEFTMDRSDMNTVKVRLFADDSSAAFLEEDLDLTGSGSKRKVTRLLPVGQVCAHISIELEFNGLAGIGVDDIVLWTRPARSSQEAA